MHDLMKYAAECMAELDRLGIRYAKNLRFTVNTRAKTRLGQCKKRGDQYEIEISHLLLDDRTPVESLKNTLHHELLHSCYGCMKHTGRWKAYAERVSAAYGYHIRRVAGREDRELPDELMPEAKYMVRCESCGAEFGRTKLSAVIQHPERYRCGKCRGQLRRVK
ncbi:MAG: SprT-like domain-containing protein [Ruminococcus sp.]|nr:SprT-like domain-containing protein [Ruminococcus sp.]